MDQSTPILVNTITDIIHGIAALIDGGSASQAANHFSKESTLHFDGSGPNTGELCGHEAVATFFQQREMNKELASRHIITNLRITMPQNGKVIASYICNVYRGTAGNVSEFSHFICDVTDQFVQENGQWKICHRYVNPIFVS